MKKLNKKQIKTILYSILTIFIIVGMVLIYFQRLQFGLQYDAHTRIDLYLGKEVHTTDIKPIVTEIFPNQMIEYQKIETFGDSISIHVKEASEEQINTLKEKIKEKYELTEETELIQTTTLGHVRARDIIKPYIIPTIIVTFIIMGYMGIRYMKLGAMKAMGLFVAKLIFSELIYIGAIGIFRIPVGIYTIPIAIAIYLAVTMGVIVKNQKQLETGKQEEKVEK